jgi:nucleotide-binding universal stress UspA family protein
MTIRTLLVAASGGSATEAAIELACRLAAQLSAHVEAYHVLLDPAAVLSAITEGGGVVLSSAYIDEMTANAEAAAARMKAVFDAAAARHGLLYRAEPAAEGASCGWRQETGYAPSLVAQRARFFDLVVLGRSERVVRAPHSDTIEETLESSGRPVLVVPSVAPAAFGRSIAVAWNGSDEAVRALAAALPVLGRAETVTAISVGDEHDVADLLAYLAWHGVAAQHRHVPPRFGDKIGGVLLGAADDAGADLLVMGGYGHRPWSETLFGGATRTAISADTQLSLLLVH